MTVTKEEFVGWCQGYIGDVLGMRPESLDPHTDFDRLGIDSAIAVSLLMEIEEKYGVDLPPEALFGNPNLDAVADCVITRVERVA